MLSHLINWYYLFNDSRVTHWGRRVIGISGSLIWSKTLMELIFNPCGEFRWTPEGQVSQIYSPHLLVGAPGIFSDLLRFVQMLKREWGAESNGKLPHLFIPSRFLSLQRKTCLWAELQPQCLSLQWRTCPWAEHWWWWRWWTHPRPETVAFGKRMNMKCPGKNMLSPKFRIFWF